MGLADEAIIESDNDIVRAMMQPIAGGIRISLYDRTGSRQQVLYRMTIAPFTDAAKQHEFEKELNSVLSGKEYMGDALARTVLLQLKAAMPGSGIKIRDAIEDPMIRQALGILLMPGPAMGGDTGEGYMATINRLRHSLGTYPEGAMPDITILTADDIDLMVQDQARSTSGHDQTGREIQGRLANAELIFNLAMAYAGSRGIAPRANTIDLSGVDFADAQIAAGSRMESAMGAAQRMGFNLDRLQIVNGVAKIQIGRTDTLARSDIGAVRDYLKEGGARSIEIYSGNVINTKLSMFLTDAARVSRMLGTNVEVLWDPVRFDGEQLIRRFKFTLKP
jgi:hypothetical protein